MEPQGVKGLVLDSAVLFRVDRNGSVQLLPDAPKFLLRLRYSNLLLGVLSLDVCQDSLSKKETLLEEIGVLDGIRIVSLSQDLLANEALKNLGSIWSVPSTSSVYVSAGQENNVIEEDIVNQGWTILKFISGNKGTESVLGALANVEQLHDILVVIANLNKRALATTLVIVGHYMKWSRELDFLKRGAFPIAPNQYGLSFIPIQLNEPLEQQLIAVDVILHKASDGAMIAPSGQFGFPDSVKFSKGICDLQRYLLDNPKICVVDPFDRILPLLDRGATQAILQSLRLPIQQIIRSPRCAEVTTFEEPWLSQALESANVVLPAIVKSRIACGASGAHTMAVVLNKEGFKGLPVPLPASIQEYVDHGAFQYKVYVVGSKLLYSRRKSTPNAAALAHANQNAPSIVFDSLKSLPEAKGSEIDEDLMTNSGGGSDDLNLETVQAAANWLRNKLGLTIIGFDLVVQAGTKDYVVVDVNYFPSFKDVPNAEAIPAFWDALLTAHCQWPCCTLL